MTAELVVLIYATQQNVSSKPFLIPVPLQIFNNVNDMEQFITIKPLSTRFIILVADELEPGILTRLSNKNNVVATLICNNSNNNLPNNQRNVLQISKHLITYKTTLYSIHAYQSISKELYASGHNTDGQIFENQAKNLLEWLKKNIQLMACHIIIIPLNTTRGNLINCQQALIEKCKILWPHKEIIICTLYDYISFEESDPNVEDPSNDPSILFQRQHRETVCSLIKNLAPIKLYLVENEDEIVNYWSRLLIARELDNGRNSIVMKFRDACTFMEYGTVDPEIRRNVAGYLGTRWQVTRTTPIRLDDIVRDPAFKIAVETVDDTLSNRENTIKVNIWQQNMNYLANTSDYTDEFHSIDQAKTCRTDQNQDSDDIIDTYMQRKYQKSPENR